MSYRIPLFRATDYLELYRAVSQRDLECGSFSVPDEPNSHAGGMNLMGYDFYRRAAQIDGSLREFRLGRRPLKFLSSFDERSRRGTWRRWHVEPLEVHRIIGELCERASRIL